VTVTIDVRTVAKRFPLASSYHMGTGVVCYQANGSLERPAEYNRRKEELRNQAPSVAGVRALVWYNSRQQMCTLRLSPALFHRRRTTFAFRVRAFLRQCAGVATARPFADNAGVEQFGYRLKTTSGFLLSAFRRALADFLYHILCERCIPCSPAGDVEVATDEDSQDQEREDDSLMKRLFPVLVCERKKDEKGKKVDGDFLEGYAPKFVPATNAESARTQVVAELLTAEKFGDPDDPDVTIQVCRFLESALA